MNPDIHLSPRLALIASLVPAGAKLVDVGTDHAYLPIRLLQQRAVSSVIATDIRPGPLQAALKNKDVSGAEGLRCVLTDGLDGISPNEADTVVLAGIGGETIVDILNRAPWALRDTRLILQPMSRPDVLRLWLCDHCVRITGEHLVMDHGKLYQIVEAQQGIAPTLSALETYTGEYGLISRDPLFPVLLQRYEKKFSVAAAGADSSQNDRSASGNWRSLLSEIETMRRRYHAESI